MTPIYVCLTAGAWFHRLSSSQLHQVYCRLVTTRRCLLGEVLAPALKCQLCQAGPTNPPLCLCTMCCSLLFAAKPTVQILTNPMVGCVVDSIGGRGIMFIGTHTTDTVAPRNTPLSLTNVQSPLYVCTRPAGGPCSHCGIHSWALSASIDRCTLCTRCRLCLHHDWYCAVCCVQYWKSSVFIADVCVCVLCRRHGLLDCHTPT